MEVWEQGPRHPCSVHSIRPPPGKRATLHRRHKNEGKAS